VRFVQCASVVSIVTGQFLIGGAAAQSPASVNQYLHKMGLNDSDIANAAAGKPIVKLLPAKSNRDVVAFGVIGVPVSPVDYLKHALQPGRLIGQTREE